VRVRAIPAAREPPVRGVGLGHRFADQCCLGEDLRLPCIGLERLAFFQAERPQHRMEEDVARFDRLKSHLAQAIGRAAILQGYRVVYREAHTLLEELAEATLAGTRKAYLTELATVPLLIIDDLGMRKLAHTAAEDLLELIVRRYERASTLLTSNRPVDDWGKLPGDTAAVTALLDRLLHHAHVLKCGPRSWRTKVQTDLRTEGATK
jgi:hypothetical protein